MLKRHWMIGLFAKRIGSSDHQEIEDFVGTELANRRKLYGLDMEY